ncbi:MAG: hypothetical protein LBD90_07175 [Bifidobacteriaceae bacterium]|jgi:hypothetical protein|nr:hypothetical protein [Bifidobacteriaceae bacterium]
MNTSTFVPAIQAYAEAVRDALTGLSPEQVQGLTDALEMDLTDALADDEGAGFDPADAALTFERITSRFGDPEVYADELRSAADLPPRSAATATAEIAGAGAEAAATPALTAATVEIDLGAGTWADGIGQGAPPAGEPRPPRRTLGEAWGDAGANWGDRRWWRALAWLGRYLRPVWWALRGLIVAWMATYWLDGVLRHPVVQVIVFCAAVGASLAAGRVDWGRRPAAQRVGMALVNALAVIAAVGLIESGSMRLGYFDPWASGEAASGDQAAEWWNCGAALCLDGQVVTNIYAFDAEGNSIEGVQLFDQSGNPLNLLSDDLGWGGGAPGADQGLWGAYTTEDGDFYVVTPYRSAAGDPLWNVYPLAAHLWRVGADGWEQLDAGQRAQVPPFEGQVGSLDPSSLPSGGQAGAEDTGADADADVADG